MQTHTRWLVAALQVVACSPDESGEGGEGGEGGAPSSVTSGNSAESTMTRASVQESSSSGVVSCDANGTPGVCIDTAACIGNQVSVPNLCPGPAEIQCCIPNLTCDPTAHPLPNQGLAEGPADPGCPAGMVRVETFCIDRHEASLVDLQGTPLSPFHNPGQFAVRAASIPNAVPQGYISGEQAALACANAAKRLCTDEEWLRACRGPLDMTFPYGDVLELGRCNDHRSVHPAVEYFMTNDPSIFSMLDNACLNQLPASLARTGSFEECVSEEGAFDMMGNLHEWTSASAGTFRGGFYVDTVLNGPGCLYSTTAHDATHWDYSTGFRCCY